MYPDEKCSTNVVAAVSPLLVGVTCRAPFFSMKFNRRQTYAQIRSALSVQDALMYPNTEAKLGTPDIIRPIYDSVFPGSTMFPSTISSTPPACCKTSPVAVTTYRLRVP